MIRHIQYSMFDDLEVIISILELFLCNISSHWSILRPSCKLFPLFAVAHGRREKTVATNPHVIIFRIRKNANS